MTSTTNRTRTEKFCGHESMRKITDIHGDVWCVNAAGTRAYPLLGRAWIAGTYDADTARAQGCEVDATIPPSDYRVQGAGPDWRRIYDRLRAGEMRPQQ